ncbi:MAG TPA: hypothetical protein VJX71_20825 [Methylomirabilota bacterium]|nr:hypothetical protein [Methylomirabilota bacterium]
MDRRAFLGTRAGGLPAAPLAAAAQQPVKAYRIGFRVRVNHPGRSGSALRLRTIDGWQKLANPKATHGAIFHFAFPVDAAGTRPR